MNKERIVEQFRSVETSDLFARADQVRKQYCGEAVHLRGIIEFSNYCGQNCLYCGLRQGNEKVARYRMTFDEIVLNARRAVELGIPTIVLQSGEDLFYHVDDFCRMIHEIKKFNIAITLSIGERPKEDYRKLKEAGADRYLLRFETSDEKLYARLRPGHLFSERLQCLHWLKELGYQVGSGIMVGLPGQTPESIADDILLFRSLELDMIGIGPFLPHPNTPLAGDKDVKIETVLKVIALTRIITCDAHIPATTAVGTLDAQGRQKALACGANIIMPNITPMQYRKFYEIYPDKICLSEDASTCRKCVEKMILAAGRKIGIGFGHTLKK
ncbi:MAG TPA: [FeFe] hydrogenase H-cluster radical SAM maturase HydE [Candidatus Omnitrophota bacterium]|nr:[FeFe] hydrogenase H-cluster radical SAM maturase HydE [Candidatus Omnitrophota bacterium]